MQVFGRLLGPNFLDCSQAQTIKLFSPFLMGDQLHFHKVHYIGNQFQKLDSCCAYHCQQVLTRSLSIIIGGDMCQQLWTIPLPSPLEVGARIPFITYGGLRFLFCVFCKKWNISTLRKHFKQIAQSFFLQHHL
jgi:hypothetical protein